MTLQDYFRTLLQRWRLIVAGILLGTGVAGGLAALEPPGYTATLTMYVAAGSGDVESAYQGGLLAQQRAKFYAELLGSSRVAAEVAARLTPPGTADELLGRISATSAEESVLIDVVVTEESGQRAADIANAVGEVFPDLANELDSGSTPRGALPVGVQVLAAAAVPDEPSSAGLPVILALGFLAGLAVGCLAAVLRATFDPLVGTAEQLQVETGAPHLGSVRRAPGYSATDLALGEHPLAARSEEFRQLRAKLRSSGSGSSPVVILVVSALPQEGRTTTVGNLANATGLTGRRVLVIEADLRHPELAHHLDSDAPGLTEVLAGRVSWRAAVTRFGRDVDVITAGSEMDDAFDLLGSAAMEKLLEEARTSYDLVLVDTPSMLDVADVLNIAPNADAALLVCRFRHVRKQDVRQAAEMLAQWSVPLIGTVLTMTRSPRNSAPWAGRPVDARVPRATEQVFDSAVQLEPRPASSAGQSDRAADGSAGPATAASNVPSARESAEARTAPVGRRPSPRPREGRAVAAQVSR